MNRLFDGERVRMDSDTYPKVPKGTMGTVVRMDDEDTDIWTYTVDFDNGVEESGVRVYHLIRSWVTISEIEK